MIRILAVRAFAAVLMMVTAPLCAAEHGLERYALQHDGIEREYFVHVPEHGGEHLPVVIALHGYTSTASGFAATHGMNRVADEHGYLVVYPQGSHFLAENAAREPYRVTSWNDLAANLGPRGEGPHCTPDREQYPCPPECGACNQCAWTSCYDDLGFIERVLDQVAARYSTDTGRYYLLGVSNGGMMALRLGCDMSDRFAAVVPIIAQLAPGYECGPDVDVPMLQLFGGEDDTVRYDGQPGADGFRYASAADTAATWAQALHCRRGPVAWENALSQRAGLVCTAYTDCRKEGHEVVSCMDPDGGHAWPEQYVTGVPATCVTDEQAASMPGQAPCPPPSGKISDLGMQLVWQFVSRYRNEPRH